MRDATHGQRRRALFTLRVKTNADCRRPAILSFASAAPAADHNCRAALWAADRISVFGPTGFLSLEREHCRRGAISRQAKRPGEHRLKSIDT
jgi:hypothetical protein